MIRNVEQITQLLFGTEHIEEVSVAELREMVDEFPSFIAGHYLLSKKLQTAGHESYLPETQRTALYFTNPFWLQWLLTNPQVQESVESVAAKYLVEEEPKPSEEPYHETHIMPEMEGYAGEAISEQLTVDPPRQPYSFPEETFPETATTFEPEAAKSDSYKVQEEDISPVEMSTPVEISEPKPIENTTKNHFFWEKEFYIGESVEAPQPDKHTEASEHGEPASHMATPEHLDIVEEPGTLAIVEASKQEEDNQYPENPAFLLAEGDDIAQEEKHHLLADQSANSSGQHSELFPESPPDTVMETFHEISDDQNIKSADSMAYAEDNLSIQDPRDRQHSIISQEIESEPAPERDVADANMETEEITFAQSLDQAHADTKSETEELVSAYSHDLASANAERESEQIVSVQSTDADIADAKVEAEPRSEEMVAFHWSDSSSSDTKIAPDQNTEVVATVQSAAEDFASTKIKTEETASVESPVLASAVPQFEDELKFEPYHTIDYFASLGIKFIQEENPSDQFGKQLKSFTAWLKTMKRLPTTMLETEMNAVTEATIQDIAEHSIEEREVLTEAMAEVLAMQGKMEKAIEIYHKLSLLNPSKSAYFAARIEHFKVN